MTSPVARAARLAKPSSLLPLLVALLLVAAAGTLPDAAGAANEQPTETDSKKSHISYSLIKATCPTIPGAEFYETNTTYGCRYGDGGSNDCTKKDEMCSYTPPQDDKKPSGKPAPTDPRLDPIERSDQFADPALRDDGDLAPSDNLTTGTASAAWTADVAAADERNLAPGTDVGNPAPDAQVIQPATAVWNARGLATDEREVHVLEDSGPKPPSTLESSESAQTIAPATQVWAARGRTLDDQTITAPLRVDSAGTIREETTVREPDGALAPDSGQAAQAAIWIDPDPIGNPDFDEFKRDCEHQGGRVERTGEYQWTCYLPWGLTTTCDLTPSPDLYDCGKPHDTGRPDIGTNALTKDEVLVVSELVAASGTPTPGEVAVPVAELETSVEFGSGGTSSSEQVVMVATELETSVEFSGGGTPAPQRNDGGPSISGRPNLIIASYGSVYDADRGQWVLSITIENTGLGDAGSFMVDLLTAGDSPSPSFLSNGLAAGSSQTFQYPLAGCEFNGEIVVSDITNAYTEVDRAWATIIC